MLGARRIAAVVAASVPALLVLVALVLASAGVPTIVLATTAALVLGAGILLVAQRQRRLERRVARLERQARLARSEPPDPLRTRPEDVSGTVRMDGVPVPPANLRFMKESDERFVELARRIAGLVRAAQPESDARVLDVGCGYGRLAVGLMADRTFTGTYVGFDILPRHIAWCRDVITAEDARFSFAHLDVRNERYNPQGSLEGDSVPFPADDTTFDAAALFSVFTHLYLPVSRHYLSELRRVLRPGGVVVATWFLYDDERLDAVMSEHAMYPMRHELSDSSRCMRLDDPLHAISFRESTVREAAADAGLEVVEVRRGTWAEPKPRDDHRELQDLVILRRPD